MAKITELIGWDFGVGEQPVAEVDPKDGQPRHGMDGQLKTNPGKVLVFADRATNEQIRIPLTDEARQNLVQMLTGGIAVAQSITHEIPVR